MVKIERDLQLQRTFLNSLVQPDKVDQLELDEIGITKRYIMNSCSIQKINVSIFSAYGYFGVTQAVSGTGNHASFSFKMDMSPTAIIVGHTPGSNLIVLLLFIRNIHYTCST